MGTLSQISRAQTSLSGSQWSQLLRDFRFQVSFGGHRMGHGDLTGRDPKRGVSEIACGGWMG